MRFGFFKNPDSTRYCYLRLRRLKEAIKDPKILGGLLRELVAPVGTGEHLSAGDQLAAIELQIDRLRGDKTSIWHGVPAPEVLAAAIFNLRKVSDDAAGNLFSDVRLKDNLAAPIRTWLDFAGYREFTAFPPGIPRVDVVGYQAGMMGTTLRIAGVELVNDLSDLGPALERMRVFVKYTNEMYLACTPALAAEFLSVTNVARWDPAALRSKLAELGYGLLLVEGDAVSESLAPKQRQPDLTQIMAFLAARARSQAGQ